MSIEEIKIHDIGQEKSIAKGEITPRDRLQNQIRLAMAVYGKLEGFIDLDDDLNRNIIMEYWTDSDFSRIYREIENSDDFKNHPRLKGNIFLLNTEDIISYKEHGKLPE